MFKDYYCWVNKDPAAGYKPGMDFYDQGPPVAGAAAAPASPAASKNRPKASPVPSPGKAAAAAAAAAAAVPELAAVSPADETAPAAGGDAGGRRGERAARRGISPLEPRAVLLNTSARMPSGFEVQGSSRKAFRIRGDEASVPLVYP
jgi:hypothetical protein